jgi:hypothetical protein
MTEDATTNIYILKLIDNKYYVGKSDNVEKRFMEHVRGYGSAWTKKYEPIEIEEIITNASKYDEDKYVKIYMEKYGIDNVRGGAYSSIELNEDQITALKIEFTSALDLCTRCMRPGHFINSCYAKTDVNGDIIVNNKYNKKNKYDDCDDEDYDDEDDEDDEDDDDDDYDDIDDEIYKCKYCFKEFDTFKGAKFHENVHCQIKKNMNTNNKDNIKTNIKASAISDKSKSIQTVNSCYKCGREGHVLTDCYATKHIKGYILK